MRWPFRRATAPAARPCLATTAAAAPTAAADWSRPRTDWCRLPPTRPTIAMVPPVTVDADGFGTGVAGTRSIAASLRRRAT